MTTKDTNNGGPAFPTSTEHGFNSGMPGMTLRQYAAIKLRVPDSGVEWLDEMIRASQLDEIAAKALQGICASGPSDNCTNMQLAVEAYQLADAMLKAGKA